MKIKLTRLITGSAGRFPEGTILNLAPEVAAELVNAHAAIAIETPDAAPEPETAVIKTKRGRNK